MKKFICSTTSLAVLALILLNNTTTFSQITTIWKGGAPGMENEWNCPKNWSAYAVPDAFSNVIIPDVSTTSLASPVIKDGTVEVNTLFLGADASLTVEVGAQLVILEKAGSFFPPNFHPKGRILLLDDAAGINAGANSAITKTWGLRQSNK